MSGDMRAGNRRPNGATVLLSFPSTSVATRAQAMIIEKRSRYLVGCASMVSDVRLL